MEDSLIWMAENAHWLWLAGGLILLSGEMILPGAYLLWIGLAATATGVVAWIAPGLEFEGHGLIFAVLATISIYVGNRYFYRSASIVADAQVNERGKSFVGRQFLVVEAIKNGQGHVQVGDSRWMARGPDAPKGSMVNVTSVDGTVLMVEMVRDQ